MPKKKAPIIPWNSQPLEEWAKKYAPGKFINLDGHSAHYIEKGEGDPIILLHGFGADSYSWNNNIDTLAKSFKVYALDLWGFGYSTREPLNYGYPLYASQLLSFMDALKIKKASLVGQSMGGGTCILFCVQHRGRVNKIILVSSGGMPNPPVLAHRIMALPKLGELLLGLRTNTIRKLAMKRVFLYDKNRITESYFINLTRSQKIKGSNEAFLKVLRLRFFNTLQDKIYKLGEMDVPILIVWGRHDRGIPLERGQAMHRILKGSRLEVFDRSAHEAHDEQPKEFNRLAIEFLSRGD
ncbi:2-hydroxy-6-oxo-6-phenylhexa-2,4-dienoate hydrolase [subsurface metagenome]